MTDLAHEETLREDTYVPSPTVGVNPLHSLEATTPWWVSSAWGTASLAWFQRLAAKHYIRIERGLAISLRRIRCLHIPGALPAASWLVDLYTHSDDAPFGYGHTGAAWKQWTLYPESTPAIRLYRFYENPGVSTHHPQPTDHIQDRMEMLLTTAVLTSEDIATLGLYAKGSLGSYRPASRIPNLRRALLRNPTFPLIPARRITQSSPFEQFAEEVVAAFRKELRESDSVTRYKQAPNPSDLESILSNPNTPRRILYMIYEALLETEKDFPATALPGKSYILTHPNWEHGNVADLTLDAVGMANPTFGRVYPSVDFSAVEGYRTNQYTDEDGNLDLEKMFTPDGEALNAVGHFAATVKLLLEADPDEVFEGFRGLFAAATQDKSRNLHVAQFVTRHYPMLVGSAFDKQAEAFGVSSDNIPAEWLLELM